MEVLNLAPYAAPRKIEEIECGTTTFSVNCSFMEARMPRAVTSYHVRYWEFGKFEKLKVFRRTDASNATAAMVNLAITRGISELLA